MFKNYLKIAWRNLGKNKVSSFINIGGLAIGMAVAMLIGLWIWDELSAAAGMGALFITLVTVSFQSVKAALMNPVRALRSE